MDFGIAVFPTDQAIRIDELARETEARGFESLWVAEHSHIPVSRLTPYPGGSELPEWYKRTWDPFVALTLAASVTNRIRLGTGVCLLIQRDPIHTAKQVASLDLASRGRFLFGIGGGWNRDEMEDHGTD
ncbi:MAG: LLM class flavin-dependent oxidoreductase, partial [Candidatus Dormibacteraceae bacterium]